MKKTIFILLAFFFIQLRAMPLEVCGSNITMTHIRTGSTTRENKKTLARPWIIEQNGHILSLEATACTYTLQLLNSDNAVVYSTFIAEGTTEIVLPETITGDYVLILLSEDAYDFGYIAL